MEQMEQRSGWKDVLRAEVARTSQRRMEKLLGISDTTIGLVLAGKYRRSTKRIERLVQQKLMQAHERQFKQLAPDLHRRVSELVKTWGYEIVAPMFGVSPGLLRRHIKGTYSSSAHRFVMRVRLLGTPEPKLCKECGHAVPQRRGAAQ